jgi:hypothetical protein
MRDDGAPPMQPDGFAEIDREYQVDDCAGRKAESPDLQKYAHRGKVTGTATGQAAARDGEIYRS